MDHKTEPLLRNAFVTTNRRWQTRIYALETHERHRFDVSSWLIHAHIYAELASDEICQSNRCDSEAKLCLAQQKPVSQITSAQFIGKRQGKRVKRREK